MKRGFIFWCLVLYMVVAFNVIVVSLGLFLISFIPTFPPFSWKNVVVVTLMLLAGECLGGLLAFIDDDL